MSMESSSSHHGPRRPERRSSASGATTPAASPGRADVPHGDAPERGDDVRRRALASLGTALADRPYSRRGVPGSGEAIRVILVDDHNIVRAGLKALLRSAPDIDFVGEAEGGDDAVELAARVRSHVIVMDLDMPRGDGVSATRAIAALEQPPRILILTLHTEQARLLEVLEAGASGYLTKDAAERELVEAIRVVRAGEIYVRPHVARLLAARVREQAAPPDDSRRASLDSLSERERVVVRLIAEGYNGAEVGRKLGISAKTVDTYKHRIEEKLGLSHRTDYVRFALELDLLHD